MPSCAVCGTEAPSEKHLRQHIKSKPDDRVLKCEECDVTFKGAMKLKMHKNIHRVVSCKNCDKVIPYNSSSSHKIMCGGDKKELKCENCPAKFNKACNLKDHKTNNRCTVQCNLCDKTLKSAGFLEKHMSSFHQQQTHVVKTSEGHIGLFPSSVIKVRKDLSCDVCDFVAPAPSKLMRHMSKHNKPTKIKQKCPKCEKTFKYKSELNKHIPTSHRDFVKGNSRANQYRKLKQLNVPKAKQFETCTEKDLIAMLEKADVSQSQLLKVLSVLRKRFGRKAFEPNLAKKMREHLNSLDDEFETRSTTFQSKDGKDLRSSLSKTKDVNHFLNGIAELRELQKPKVILGIDGDVRHLMITAIVKESDENDDPVSAKVSDHLNGTSSKRVLILAKADGVPETRHNVEIMLNAINLHEIENDFQVVCDLKMLNILLGIQSSSSLFGCPYCEASKVNSEGKVTNQRGEWNFESGKTTLRSINNIVEHAVAYENEPLKKNGECDTTKTRNHKSIKYKPIKIQGMHDDSWVGKRLPPDPLHCNVLGPPNDLFDLMEKVFSEEKMTEFYTRNNEKRSGEAAGGKFEGNSIKNLWSEKALNDLNQNFSADIKPFVEFLRSIREVHTVCMKEELDLSFVYKEAIEKFEMNRKFLYEVFGLNHTLKMHIIRDHFVTYFKLTGKTLRDVSAEYHEGVHHTHKIHETKRGFYQKRGLGGTSHVKKSQRSTAQFNVLHAGFAKRSDLQLRKPNKNKTEVVEICSI